MLCEMPVRRSSMSPGSLSLLTESSILPNAVCSLPISTLNSAFWRFEMAHGIKLHVWGDWACFTRPEMKVERVSYEVITPSAARGILEAIYWKPEICWIVDRLTVLKPIRFTSMKRNEVSVVISARTAKQAKDAGSGNLGFFVEDER